jgi:hypothetical protein
VAKGFVFGYIEQGAHLAKASTQISNLTKPLANVLLIPKKLCNEKVLIVEISAQIQVCVKLVLQFLLHKNCNVKCSFILDRIK